MDGEVIRKIMAMYGLEPVRFLPMQTGYRNKSFAAELPGGTLVNLIIFKTEPGILRTIKNANAVAAYAAQHLPARTLYDNRILALRPNTYAALYTYLPGATIPWEAYTQKHIKLLGKALGDLHVALAGLDHTLPDVITQSIELHARMHRYFADLHVSRALRQKLHLQIALPPMDAAFAAAKTQLAQALHMDFVRGNILFDATPQVTGILDFEKTARGPVVFDIARTLAFLLVDCKYKPAHKIRKYFLQSGYNKRSASTLPDAPGLLEQLVTFYLVHDFYKFLRHNPYESLPQNEHFTRTRDLLIAANIVK